MNNKQIILIILVVLLSVYIMSGIVSCDTRTPNPTLKLYSDTNIVYLNDQQNIISINSKYISDNKNNKRIYFKTNNGYIRKISASEWVDPLDTLYINTNKDGQCKLQYTTPKFDIPQAHIYAWTYEYNNDLTMIQSVLLDSLTLYVLHE